MQEFFQNVTDGKLFLVILSGIGLQLMYLIIIAPVCLFQIQLCWWSSSGESNT